MNYLFWIFGNKRFVLIIFMAMYHLFDRECDKKGLHNANGTEWRKTKNEAVKIWKIHSPRYPITIFLEVFCIRFLRFRVFNHMSNVEFKSLHAF